MIQKVERVLILKHCSSPVCNSCSVGGVLYSHLIDLATLDGVPLGQKP